MIQEIPTINDDKNLETCLLLMQRQLNEAFILQSLTTQRQWLCTGINRDKIYFDAI